VGEVIEHRGQVGRSDGATFDQAFGTADGRLAIEIEFALVEIRHLGEPAAQRVETDHMCVHLADAAGERVEALLHIAAGRGDVGALLFELRAPLGHLRGGIQHQAAAPQLNAGEQHAAEHQHHSPNRHRHRHRTAELELPSLAESLGEHDDVHYYTTFSLSRPRTRKPGHDKRSQIR
jgi:hypothetical protein